MGRAILTGRDRMTVRALVADGYTGPEIAAELGVCLRTLKYALRRWGDRLGRACRPVKPEHRAAVLAAAEGGGVAPQIARATGLSPTQVYRLLHELERAGLMERGFYVAEPTRRGIVWQPSAAWVERPGGFAG